jgi:hypothetical protein
MKISRLSALKPSLPTGTCAITALVALTLFCLAELCHGQGTMTFRFEGQPVGTSQQLGVYVESGMQFGMAYGPGSVYLSGGGIPGYPDNGTGYLEIPDGNITRLRFGFNVFPQTFPASPFDLLSFDAASYWDLGPQTLEVVGYHLMSPTVTNYFTVGHNFQTFYPDSSFLNVLEVDVFNARWSLDNLVVGGVPEPATSSLVFLAALCSVGWYRFRRVPRAQGRVETSR